ncbi:hypothetical protein PVAND_012742 [Polypedilum vanderplanki]|uniref:Uncharacterized protein n=1 Tax=Polypedilum vanderplanki TaxID=319348 RepID=A0A9J6CND6_POLVA|nr:hypothetical protein PVAND_012742 [Polypedilum vanderplanki]
MDDNSENYFDDKSSFDEFLNELEENSDSESDSTLSSSSSTENLSLEEVLDNIDTAYEEFMEKVKDNVLQLPEDILETIEGISFSLMYGVAVSDDQNSNSVNQN